MRLIKILPILITLTVCAKIAAQNEATTLAAADSSANQSPSAEGPTLAAEIRNLAPDKETTLRGILKIKKTNGETTLYKIISKIIPAPDGWDSIYETSNINEKPYQKLIVSHSKNKANHYLLESINNTENHVISNPPPSTAFADSDFSIGDLGLEFFHWKKQTILKTEMRKSRVCKVLESVPSPEDKNLGYSKVISWIDKETLGILIAEAYDNTGKKIKQFEVGSFQKDENGNWQIHELEIRNLKTKTKTQLIFQTTNTQ
ncbi:MAG: outer membrane lipoprotein-sorting protein [Verrucomicrobiae bacterium]|nr:outer membrane lipoprotein-sorting protein [Verrucomicrobiae bacterium]